MSEPDKHSPPHITSRLRFVIRNLSGCRAVIGSPPINQILTPDNYTEVVLQLLRVRPKQRLYFQNQSLNPVKDPTREFKELMQLLVDYSNDNRLDVRLIFRNIGPVRRKLESLKAAGF